MLRKLLAEFIGTGLLVIAVVGSGIAAERLSPGDVGLQLLENAIITGGALVAIILAVGPVSGAHLNPVVSWAARCAGGLTTGEAAGYTLAQFSGGAGGALVANAMFSVPVFELSTKTRSGEALWLSEVVATFGLVLLIFGLVRSSRTAMAPFAVGAYILGAYFFSSSTSFANPAVTAARTLTDTFSGIALASAPGFIAAQVVGGSFGLACASFLYSGMKETAQEVVVPKETQK